MKATFILFFLIILSVNSYAQALFLKPKNYISKELGLTPFGNDFYSGLNKFKNPNLPFNNRLKPLILKKSPKSLSNQMALSPIGMPVLKPDSSTRYSILTLKPDSTVLYQLQIKKIK